MIARNHFGPTSEFKREGLAPWEISYKVRGASAPTRLPALPSRSRRLGARPGASEVNGMTRRMMSWNCSPSYPPVFRRFLDLSVMISPGSKAAHRRILSEPRRIALPAADREALRCYRLMQGRGTLPHVTRLHTPPEGRRSFAPAHFREHETVRCRSSPRTFC